MLSMADAENCRCCRSAMLADDPPDAEMCSVCLPWNNLRELMRTSVPAWQIHMQRDQQQLLDDADDWLDGDGAQIAELLPSEPAWAALLRAVSGQRHIRADSDELDLESEPELDALRTMLTSNHSPLFPGVADNDVDPQQGKLSIEVAGHRLVSDGRSLLVDGVLIEAGPGDLLLRMLFEANYEVATVRFLRMLAHIEGRQDEDGENLELRRRRAALRSCRFHSVGAADAPRPAANLRGFMESTPPLCDWDSKRWMLGIDDGTGSRVLMPLPSTPTLVERFLSIWSGRPNRRVSDRLRAICLRWAARRSTPSPEARITPHERSFGMLRGVIDANPERVALIEDGLLITGTIGVRWSITKGRGVHNTPYVIEPVCMIDPERKGNQVCLYDQSTELPLGDRLGMTVLGLLNDSIIAQTIPQVALAAAMLNYPSRGVNNPQLAQILRQFVQVAED